MEKSKVYYTSFRTTLDTNILQKLRKLITKAGMPTMDLDGNVESVDLLGSGLDIHGLAIFPAAE